MGLLACCVAYGQVAAPSPAFEVASVKLSPPPREPRGASCKGGPGTTDPGFYTCTNSDISFLVGAAFGLYGYQFPSADNLDRAKYEVSVKIQLGTTSAQFHKMLQNLLIERFKLRYHWEKREMQVYDVVVAKGGLKMKRSPPPQPPGQDRPEMPPAQHAREQSLDADGYPIVPPLGRESQSIRIANGRERWASTDTELEEIVSFVGSNMGGPATDSTGLKGRYDFTLSWVMDGDSNATGPTFVEALQEQLGLKIERKKGLVDVFVIDHMERIPIGN
jgi:uncharacterized protein (TIGR03435 family)